MLVKIETCPICGGTVFTEAFQTKDYYATGEVFVIERCKICGFKLTQNFPAENEIGRYYDTAEYISHSDTKKGIVNYLYHVIRDFMMKKKLRIVEENTRSTSKKLLDFGCGIGTFLSTMQQNGWSVKGIEKNDNARATANKNFGVTVYGPEEMKSFQDTSFGVVTAWHSVEHIENLEFTIREFHRVLVENGTLYIAVPNSNSVDAEYYKEMWAAYDVPRHLWHFTPETMKKLAEKCGFGVEKYFSMPFDAFYISMLSEKYKKSSLSFIKGAIVGFYCYLKSIGKPWKSSSVLYVLKKSDTLNFKI